MPPPAVSEPIERIQDLNLPPEAETVFEHLTEPGAERFSYEIVQALVRAQARGDLRPVFDVVDAWYRTLVMKTHPDYLKAVRWARAGGSGESFSAEELKTRASH